MMTDQTKPPADMQMLAGVLRSLDPDVPEWVVADFEFWSQHGSKPKPHHLAAIEIFSGRQHLYAPEELAAMTESPFPSGYGLIAFSADAEHSCIIALGWEKPAQTIDLRVEHMMLDRNVSHVESLSVNLEEMLAHFGLSHPFPNKKELQTLCGSQTTFTPEQEVEIKAYVMADVMVELKALACIASRLHPSCLFRGRYMRAISVIQDRGIPFDVETFNLVKNNRETLKM
jgi:hypothetical protein